MIGENRVGTHARPQLSQDKLDRDAGPADHGLAAHNLRVDLDPCVRHFVSPAASAGIAMRANPRNTRDKQAPDFQQTVSTEQNGGFDRASRVPFWLRARALREETRGRIFTDSTHLI